MIGKTIRHLAVGAAALLAGTGAALAGKANDTFVWATSTEIGPPDLYYGNQREVLIIAYAQCNSLLHRDPVSNDYKPLLAETWTWLDPTTLELTLRKGVKFHDGREFGAQDVADTLNHVARPDSGMQIRVIVDWIKNVEVVAPDKVRIHAKAPTPAALEFLSGTTPIYPRGHYESAPTVPAPDGKTRRDWGAVKPICTGPYILKDHKPGQSVTLTKNPNYFAGSPKGKPQIGTIVYRTIKDAETQVAELLTGGVDWIWGVPPENAKQLGAMPNVVVKSAATMRMSFLSLDAAGRTGDTPLKDVRVRRAIFHAIDREAIAKNLVGEGAAVQKSLCVPVQFGCTTDVPDYPYDPAKAKALLAEAGHPNLLDPLLRLSRPALFRGGAQLSASSRHQAGAEVPAMAGAAAFDHRGQNRGGASDLRVERHPRCLGLDELLFPPQRRRLCARSGSPRLACRSGYLDGPREPQGALCEGAEKDQRPGLCGSALHLRAHLRLQPGFRVPADAGRDGAFLHGALEVTSTGAQPRARRLPL